MTEQSPKRILVIDDDVDYRNLLVRLLSKAFPGVKVASLDPLKKGLPGDGFDWAQFDVVIIDYNLGKVGSGLACVERIRKHAESPPATILLTAEGNEEIAAKAFRQGVHDYLPKQGLTGKTLTNSIKSAFNVRSNQVRKNREISLNATRFSRTFFYEQANLAREEATQGFSRALLLVRPADRERLEKTVGLLAMDEITRYLAKLTVQVFRVSKYPARSTRFGESSIAVIIGDFGSKETLEDLVRKFLQAVERTPPEFDGKRLPVSVSMGAVRIVSAELDTGGLLALAEEACESVETSGKSTYAIVDGAAPVPDAGGETPDDAQAGARVPGIDIKAAIRESRIQPMFRPLMPVSDESGRFGSVEIFQINPYVVGHDGSSVAVSEAFGGKEDDNARKMIDRWTLREAQKRLKGPFEGSMPGFIVALSGPSSADQELPGWTEKLLDHFGLKKNTAFFCLKVDAAALAQGTKTMVGVCVKLRQRYGFRVAVGEVDAADLANRCFAQMPIDFVHVPASIFRPKKPDKKAEENTAAVFEVVTAKSALSIVGGVADANDLHAAITAGADFVHGDFVGPEQLEVESAVGIETVSL